VRSAGAAPASVPLPHDPQDSEPQGPPHPGVDSPRRGLIVRGQGTDQERALKRVAAYFPAALGTELAVYSARTGLTMSDVIVESVRRFLASSGT
jgi:hypothetical protein